MAKSNNKPNNKIKNPNASGNGGRVAIVVLLLAAVALIAGLVIWQVNDSKPEVTELNAEATYSDGVVTLGDTNAGDDVPVIELYEDYSCPHCGDLAVASDERLHDELVDGKIVVNVRSMNFLDRGEEGHSTMSLAALTALAERGEFDAWWNLRDALMRQQYKIRGNWDNNDFADAAQEAGASDDAVQDIRDGKYLEEANEIGSANLADQESRAGGDAYTPRVFEGNQEVEINEISTAWIDEVVNN